MAVSFKIVLTVESLIYKEVYSWIWTTFDSLPSSGTAWTGVVHTYVYCIQMIWTFKRFVYVTDSNPARVLSWPPYSNSRIEIRLATRRII